MDHGDVDVPPDVRGALDALSLLARKWHPVVLAVLAHRGACGFTELRDEIPDISGKVLSETLERLQDAGLVERTVVSESPLRVEYEPTAAGQEIESVFDELAAWRERHLGSMTATVLVAGADRRLTDMYGDWLTDRYAVERAHDGDEVVDAFAGDVDVVVYGQDVPGLDAARVPDLAGPDCRAILLVTERPALDVLDVDCDDVLAKPVVREELLKAVEWQWSRRDEPKRRREYNALSAKQSALERVQAPEALADSDRYAALCSRLETLEAELDE